MNIRKFSRTLISAVLCAAFLASSSAAFSDTEGHWAQADIAKWSGEYNILRGNDDGTFRPDDPITRGAFAGIMDRFFHYAKTSAPEVFPDLGGHYWEDAVLKLHAAGVYRGSDGLAIADAPISRQQAVTMLGRAFAIEGAEKPLPFSDAAAIASYAVGAVAAMTDLGYLGGTAFRPDDPITRAEFVTILSRIVTVLVQEEGTYTQDLAGNVMLSCAGDAEFKNLHIGGDLIISPGVGGTVTLRGVTLDGEVRNLGKAKVDIITAPEWLEGSEDGQPIDPLEIYTPTEKTGETILFQNTYTVPVYAGRTPIAVGEGDFKWRDDRLVYRGDAFESRFGIDVSAHQNRSTEGGIDWEAVAEDDVEFVMVRAGYRGTTEGGLYADEFCGENIDGAMAAGIETGVYFFSQAITVEEAIEEAEFVISLLEGHEINGPVAYDWEMKDSSYRVYGTSPEMATACAIAFCERIKAEGYTPMIYASGYVNYMKYDQGAIEPYMHWYPEYKSGDSEKLYPVFLYQMDYWQFSDRCTVKGITGRVDGNLHFY